MPPVNNQDSGATQSNDQPNDQQATDDQLDASFDPQTSQPSNANPTDQPVNEPVPGNVQPNQFPDMQNIDNSPAANAFASSVNDNSSAQTQNQIDSLTEPNSGNSGVFQQPTVQSGMNATPNNQTLPSQAISQDQTSLAEDYAFQSSSVQGSVPPPSPTPLDSLTQPVNPNIDLETAPIATGASDNLSSPNIPTGDQGLANPQTPAAQQSTDFYTQPQDMASNQGGEMVPPEENYDMNQSKYAPAPAPSSGGNKMIFALVVIGIAILALAAGLGYILIRKKSPQTVSNQPVQTEQPKVEEVTIEFNKEITIPAGYVLVENDCYKTIVLAENTLKKTDNCSLSGTYGKKALSSLSIADSSKLISIDDIKNSAADKIKQAINAAQTASGVTIDVISAESIKLGQADAVKVIYNMTSAGKTTKMADVFVVAPKDRYKTSTGNTIESFVLSGSYGDTFSQENFDKVINNWSWK